MCPFSYPVRQGYYFIRIFLSHRIIPPFVRKKNVHPKNSIFLVENAVFFPRIVIVVISIRGLKKLEIMAFSQPLPPSHPSPFFFFFWGRKGCFRHFFFFRSKFSQLVWHGHAQLLISSQTRQKRKIHFEIGGAIKNKRLILLLQLILPKHFSIIFFYIT